MQCRSVFFKQFVEGHDLALATRLVDLLCALEAEVAFLQERDIRGRTVPGDAERALDKVLEVGDGPELAIGGGSLRSEELARRRLPERSADAVALGRRELGTVAAKACIAKASETVGAIASAPVHERGARAAGNLLDLGKGIG